MKLKKNTHLFIPFDENGKNLVGGYGQPYIYQSMNTAIRFNGRDAYEVVEYAPIIKCKNCRHFVPSEDDEEWNGFCVYNSCYTDSEAYCYYGHKREDKNCESKLD